MQKRIDDEVQLNKTVSPFDATGQSSSVDRTAGNLINTSENVQKIKCLINTGEYGADLARYIPGIFELVFQGMIENIDTKEQVFSHFLQRHGNIEVSNNYYTNHNSIIMHICFPFKVKKVTNEASDIDTDLITVNKFFAHFVKEINITRYGNDKQLMTTFSPYDI